MAINYSGTTIGTLTLCQKKRDVVNGEVVEVKDDKGRQVYNKYKIQIRDSNCLMCAIHVWKDPNPEDPEHPWHHDLQMFFVDECHMKRCLEKYGKNAFETLFFGKLKDIKLNIYYKEMLTLAKYMAKDGLKVQVYYKEPKKKR